MNSPIIPDSLNEYLKTFKQRILELQQEKGWTDSELLDMVLDISAGYDLLEHLKT